MFILPSVGRSEHEGTPVCILGGEGMQFAKLCGLCLVKQTGLALLIVTDAAVADGAGGGLILLLEPGLSV